MKNNEFIHFLENVEKIAILSNEEFFIKFLLTLFLNKFLLINFSKTQIIQKIAFYCSKFQLELIQSNNFNVTTCGHSAKAMGFFIAIFCRYQSLICYPFE